MEKRKRICVRDVMNPNFDIVDRMATVREVLVNMKHVENKSVIVKKRDENDEIGIVLFSDIARNVLGKDHASDRINVYEIMQKPAISVHPNMDIRYCARLLGRFHLTRVPVIENNTIVGMVSFTDLIIRGLVEQEGLEMTPSAAMIR